MSNYKSSFNMFKRFIGRSYADPEVQMEKALLSYELESAEDGSINIRAPYGEEEQEMSPEHITSMMLTKLKSLAEATMEGQVCVLLLIEFSVSSNAELPCSSLKSEWFRQ